MKKTDLLEKMKEFGQALVRPVSTGARVSVKLLRAGQPCRVELRVKAAPSLRAGVLERVGDGRALQAAWTGFFPAGGIVQVSPKRRRMEGAEVVFECNLLTLEVEDG